MAFFKSGGDADGGQQKPVTLSGLYGMVEDAQKQIAEYLLKREAELRSAAKDGGATVAAGVVSGAAALDPRQISQMLSPVIERLDAIGEMLAEQGGGGAGGSAVAADTGALERLMTERFNRLEAYMTGNTPEPLEGAMENHHALQNHAQPSHPEPEYHEPPHQPQYAASHGGHGGGGGDGAWEEAIFGPYLAGNRTLTAYRQSLLQGIRHGDMNSRYFAGVLMMFQAAAPDKMVLLLKDLGEAFYRWSPKRGIDPDAMEVSLQEFATQACERAGLPNSIELVHPGQRFDSARHNATSRGVEVTNVLGWVVLRGNGSVYAKATVEVR